MRNYKEIPPLEIIKIGEEAIKLLIFGFENIGFRKSTRKRLDALEDIIIKQNFEINELKKITNYENN